MRVKRGFLALLLIFCGALVLLALDGYTDPPERPKRVQTAASHTSEDRSRANIAAVIRGRGFRCDEVAVTTGPRATARGWEAGARCKVYVGGTDYDIVRYRVSRVGDRVFIVPE